MNTLLPVMILCCAADGTIDREQLKEFKLRIRRPESVMMWLRDSKNRDAIDVDPSQYKDLRDVMLKHRRQIAKIKDEMREKHPYPVEPATGLVIGVEASRAHDRFLKAVHRACIPVNDAWRKDIRRILTASQIAKMNEIGWRNSGAEMLFDDDFQRILKLDEQQRTSLKELYRWSMTAPEDSPFGGPTGAEPVMIAKQKEAQEKALEILTPEQRKAFDFLLGLK